MENPYPVTPGNIHCHLAYGATSEDQLNAKEYCRGDFCVLQKTVVPGYGTQWLKGCLSANESETASKLKVGYRNILGIEQWFCQTDFCNFDVQSVGESTPHLESLQFYKNKEPRGGLRIIEDSSHEMEDENIDFDGKENIYAVKIDPEINGPRANKKMAVNYGGKLICNLFLIVFCLFWAQI